MFILFIAHFNFSKRNRNFRGPVTPMSVAECLAMERPLPFFMTWYVAIVIWTLKLLHEENACKLIKEEMYHFFFSVAYYYVYLYFNIDLDVFSMMYIYLPLSMFYYCGEEDVFKKYILNRSCITSATSKLFQTIKQHMLLVMGC